MFRRAIIPFGAVPLLAGCALQSAPTPLSWDRGFFACSTVGGQNGGRDRDGSRVIGIFPDPSGRSVALNLGYGDVQTLALTRSANGGFYSNSSWAWKSADQTASLTDIQNIDVRSCRPVRLANVPDAPGHP